MSIGGGSEGGREGGREGVTAVGLAPPLPLPCRLTTEIQAQISRAESNTPEPKDEKWSDFVDDLWEGYLPYFNVISNGPAFADSFSEETDPSATILNELTQHNSEQEFKKDAPVHRQAPPSPILNHL